MIEEDVKKDSGDNQSQRGSLSPCRIYPELELHLRRVRRSALFAWRSDYDPGGTGQVTHPDFLRISKVLDLENEAIAFWKYCRPDRSTAPWRFPELAPKEASNLKAFVDFLPRNRGTRWPDSQDLAAAWRLHITTKCTSTVRQAEFVRNVKALPFRGDAKLLYYGLRSTAGPNLSRFDFECLNIATLLGTFDAETCIRRARSAVALRARRRQCSPSDVRLPWSCPILGSLSPVLRSLSTTASSFRLSPSAVLSPMVSSGHASPDASPSSAFGHRFRGKVRADESPEAIGLGDQFPLSPQESPTASFLKDCVPRSFRPNSLISDSFLSTASTSISIPLPRSRFVDCGVGDGVANVGFDEADQRPVCVNVVDRSVGDCLQPPELIDRSVGDDVAFEALDMSCLPQRQPTDSVDCSTGADVAMGGLDIAVQTVPLPEGVDRGAGNDLPSCLSDCVFPPSAPASYSSLRFVPEQSLDCILEAADDTDGTALMERPVDIAPASTGVVPPGAEAIPWSGAGHVSNQLHPFCTSCILAGATEGIRRTWLEQIEHGELLPPPEIDGRNRVDGMGKMFAHEPTAGVGVSRVGEAMNEVHTMESSTLTKDQLKLLLCHMLQISEYLNTGTPLERGHFSYLDALPAMESGQLPKEGGFMDHLSIQLQKMSPQDLDKLLAVKGKADVIQAAAHAEIGHTKNGIGELRQASKKILQMARQVVDLQAGDAKDIVLKEQLEMLSMCLEDFRDVMCCSGEALSTRLAEIREWHRITEEAKKSINEKLDGVSSVTVSPLAAEGLQIDLLDPNTSIQSANDAMPRPLLVDTLATVSSLVSASLQSTSIALPRLHIAPLLCSYRSLCSPSPDLVDCSVGDDVLEVPCVQPPRLIECSVGDGIVLSGMEVGVQTIVPPKAVDRGVGDDRPLRASDFEAPPVAPIARFRGAAIASWPAAKRALERNGEHAKEERSGSKDTSCIQASETAKVRRTWLDRIAAIGKKQEEERMEAERKMQMEKASADGERLHSGKGIPPPLKGKGGNAPTPPSKGGKAPPPPSKGVKGTPPLGKGCKGAAPTPLGKGRGGPPSACGKVGDTPTDGQVGEVTPRSRPDWKPTFPLRKLYWKSFQLNDEGEDRSIWDVVCSHNELDLDFMEFEELFAEKPKPTKDVDLGAEKAVKKSSVEKASCLEKSRSQNLAVMLARLGGVEKAIGAVRTLNTSMLTKDQVELLISSVPTTDEVELMRAQKETHGVEVVWETAEAYVLAIMAVQHYKLKLDIWNFENIFMERLLPAKKALVDIAAACGALMQSPALRHVLGLVLMVGNYLNAGTARGRADGFGLEALVMMGSVKHSRGGTLVDYLAKQLVRKFPDEMDKLFASDGDADVIQAAARASIAESKKDIEDLRKEALTILKTAHHVLEVQVDDAKDIVLLRHVETISMCLEDLYDVERGFAAFLRTTFEELSKWFRLSGEAKTSVDKFFEIWNTFLTELRQATQLVIKQQLLQEKLQMQQEELERKKAAKALESAEAVAEEDERVLKRRATYHAPDLPRESTVIQTGNRRSLRLAKSFRLSSAFRPLVQLDDDT